jgi:hypothetical protein
MLMFIMPDILATIRDSFLLADDGFSGAQDDGSLFEEVPVSLYL